MSKMLEKTRYPLFVLLFAGSALLSQCSQDDGSFVPKVEGDEPDTIQIVSGNNQYSLHGTELLKPLVVAVTTAGGAPLRGATVTFLVTQGGGTLGATSALTNQNGRASTTLTLGSANGMNGVRATVAAKPSLFVEFGAVSSNFYCAEAEDSLQVCAGCATRYGPQFDLFLVTARSSLYADGSAGVVQVKLASEEAMAFTEVPVDQGFFSPVIFDGVFSPRGDYYVARRTIFPEILKIAVDGTVTRFAGLEASSVDDAVELAANPVGLLVGCDIKGPFVVRCRDTIVRFDEAMYTDEINNDALAVDPRRQTDDPLGEDIYFIDTSVNTLQRLPMDSLSVEPQGLQMVAQLTHDQATGARGMVCDDLDGSVYILVDAANTKELLQVTPGGVVTQLFDFFSRGGGTPEEAGIQSDLALRQPYLFTIDTLNDKLLVYDLGGAFSPLFSDSTEQAKLSVRDASGNPFGGERVGLDVLK